MQMRSLTSVQQGGRRTRVSSSCQGAIDHVKRQKDKGGWEEEAQSEQFMTSIK